MPEEYISLERGKILIVDDSRLALRGFVRELQEAGYDVYGAVTGREAIDITKAVNLDLVFTDLMMPEMSGTELCQEIKRISPDTEVVLVSGYPDQIEKFKNDFMEAGGKIEILRKPLGPFELKNTAAKILKNRAEKNK